MKRTHLLTLLASIAAWVTTAIAERPNILIAISDDQSHPHTSAYGSTFVRTPAFDRVAKDGILFHNAFVASPGCSPSRAALLTGRYPWQIEHAGTHASSFPAKYPVFQDLLEDAGYHAGYTGKGWGPGNFKESGRPRNPAGPQFSSRKMKSPDGISTTDYAANFEDFLKKRSADQPFSFWFGGHEPHRVFKRGIGVENGGKLGDVEVPEFLPDTETVRTDLLDYAFEIEWFDQHVERMLSILESQGLLNNTIVVVTSDNGMAFPRAKANTYEYGIHVPLAVSWPAQVTGGRQAPDLVSLIDLAPTFLDAAGVNHPKTPRMTGKSLLPFLTGRADRGPRSQIMAGRERHSSSRYNNWTYPQRVVRTKDWLFVWNLKADRWPAGDPRKFEKDGSLGPMHGGYHDIDACPTLDELIVGRDDPAIGKYLRLAVEKRPEFEMYDMRNDRACLNNLADKPRADQLKKQLISGLEQTQDTRLGADPEVWERYKRYSPIRSFPAPE